MSEIVIWAQSICRSTMALYREVKRQCNALVTVVMRQNERGEYARQVRETQGQQKSDFTDVVDVEWDGGLSTGLNILESHSARGTVHIFSGYQVSTVVRALMHESHRKGLRGVVYDEAPCEMCIGLKALLKRAYYRLILPCRVRDVVACADLFLNASGRMGCDRLVQLGWDQSKILPFGYASEVASKFRPRKLEKNNKLRILHSGIETPYRDVSALKSAATILKSRGLVPEVIYTGGSVLPEALNHLYDWADVFVACGLCEPWGIRVNDAIHAGLPVFVSSGMGVELLVEQYGCGGVFHKSSPEELANLLERYATDAAFRTNALAGVAAAHKAWAPDARAKDLLAALAR